MEQIVVELSPFTRRSRSIAVSHVSQGLEHGLEPGEHVVVHEPVTGEYFSALVADVAFELADTSYRLEIGGRITFQEAAEWTAPPSSDDRLTTRDLIDLLAELRRSERDIAEAMADFQVR